jgi:hypothetical protein
MADTPDTLRALLTRVAARRRRPNPLHPLGFPVFFATRPLEAPNVTIRAGDPFPYQDLRTIQGYGEAYGVPDARGKRAEVLDYIEMVDVYDQEVAQYILRQGLAAPIIKKLLRELA